MLQPQGLLFVCTRVNGLPEARQSHLLSRQTEHEDVPVSALESSKTMIAHRNIALTHIFKSPIAQPF